MIVGRAKVGRYEIERHVASGGMAEVYLARDPATGGRVALKIPHDGEEIWEAERTGAVLQIRLSSRDVRVPRVHEIGEGDERFVPADEDVADDEVDGVRDDRGEEGRARAPVCLEVDLRRKEEGVQQHARQLRHEESAGRRHELGIDAEGHERKSGCIRKDRARHPDDGARGGCRASP